MLTGRPSSARRLVEPHPHGVAVGEPGELVKMRELAQLLLGPLAGGDVLVHERHPANPAVLGEYRCGGEAHFDRRPILADAGGLDRRNDLAGAGACMECERFVIELGGDHLDVLAEHLRLGVTVHFLRGAIPHEQPPIEVRADDRDRRRIDDGVERILGALQIVDALEPCCTPALHRRRHPVERLAQPAEFARPFDRGAVAELSGGENGGVPLELPQRTDDAARQHPGDRRGDRDRREAE